MIYNTACRTLYNSRPSVETPQPNVNIFPSSRNASALSRTSKLFDNFEFWSLEQQRSEIQDLWARGARTVAVRREITAITEEIAL